MTTAVFETSAASLIEQIKADTHPKWGIMTAQHMIEHLGQAIMGSIGKFTFPVFTPEEKLPTYKKVLMSDRPLPRNFKAPVLNEDELPALHFADMEKAKAALLHLIEEFDTYYKKNPEALHNHPVFGPLNHQEWIFFHNKHFTHHFTQFGLLEDQGE